MTTFSVHADGQHLRRRASDPLISQNEVWTETWTFLAAKLKKEGNTIVPHFLHWIDFWNNLKLIHPRTIIRICMTQSAVPVWNLSWPFVEITFLSFHAGNYCLCKCFVWLLIHVQIPLTCHILVYLLHQQPRTLYHEIQYNVPFLIQ